MQAPDGTIWKVATSAKKDTGPATREIDEIVLLLGVADVAASKRFYVDHGLAVAKSFGRKYVEFDMPSGAVKLALYGRRALAKDAGVAPDGSGSHRLDDRRRRRALHRPGRVRVGGRADRERRLRSVVLRGAGRPLTRRAYLVAGKW